MSIELLSLCDVAKNVNVFKKVLHFAHYCGKHIAGILVMMFFFVLLRVACICGACVAATTSLLAATLSVVRSCFAVVMLYGLCYIGIKVTISLLYIYYHE